MIAWLPVLPTGFYVYFKKYSGNPELFLAFAFRLGLLSLSKHQENRLIIPIIGQLLLFVFIGLEHVKTKSSKAEFRKWVKFPIKLVIFV